MVEGTAVKSVRANVPAKPAQFTEPEDRADSDIREWEANRDNGVERLVPQETPPKTHRPSLRERATDVVAKARTAPKKAASKPRGPRKTLDGLIGGAWSFVAQIMQPINLPVARVLAVQAPVAGMVLEDALKNTAVDRLLQPLAGVQIGGEIALALIGPPLLVGALSVRPEMAPMLVPLLRRALRSWIDVAGPKLEEVAKTEKKFEEQYGTQIDDMIEFFLETVKEPDDTSVVDGVFTGASN